MNLYRSLRNGTGEYLKSTFDHIMNTDNVKDLSADAEGHIQNLTKQLEAEQAKESPNQTLITNIEEQITGLEKLKKLQF